MDKFLIQKSTAVPMGRVPKSDKSEELKFTPYSPSKRPLKNLKKSTESETRASLNKHLVDTLQESSNPITHSDLYERADHVFSTTSGHQRSERVGGFKAVYVKERSHKLENQKAVSTSDDPKPLQGARIYIDGFLEGTTDIEMKRIVGLAGGKIMFTAGQATHIVTSQELSKSKTQQILKSKANKRKHVVRPEWVTDSIEAGKRKPEKDYGVIQHMSTMDLRSVFKPA